MIGLEKVTILSGLISAISLAAVLVRRQGELEVTALGSIGIAYFAASNIPAGIYLCWYSLHPDPPSVLTKLQGMEKYICFAGVSLLILSTISLWGQFRTPKAPK